MWTLAHQFLKDRRGTVLVYVTIILGVLVGFVGLAIDGGRLFISNTQAQAAADAAALAAASQLDGTSDGITRATNAAMTTPLVSNLQKLAENDADPSKTGGTVKITQIRFLSSLPADSVNPIPLSYYTTDPGEARFAEVTTEDLTLINTFIRVVGAGATSTTQAVAIAGFKQQVCNFPPLMICNPWENVSTSFPPPGITIRGKEVLSKTNSGGGSAWGPGDFGLLDPPDGNTGAKAVSQKIAAVQPSGCYSAKVDMRPGAVDSMRSALNTRFDQYENPYFQPEKNNPEYRPAMNVIKGKVKQSAGATCDDVDPSPPASEAEKLPRGQCFDGGTGDCTLYNGQIRIGDGIWDRDTYWSVNHPGIAEPSGYSDFSRYDTYRYEIDNGMVPDNTGSDPTTPAGEDGNPQCYTGGTLSDTPDRRVLYMAVINCEEEAINGAQTGVNVKAFVKMFVSEPVVTDPSDGTKDQIWLEFVDITKPGADDGVLHDIVQLYR